MNFFDEGEIRMKMISVPQFGKNVVEWVGGVLGFGRWYRYGLRCCVALLRKCSQSSGGLVALGPRGA